MMTFPEQYRLARPLIRDLYSDPGDQYGCFQIPARVSGGRVLNVIACDAAEVDWEHVSVSVQRQPDKCPGWDEMCVVKALFWEPEDAVVEFHPPVSEYVNNRPGVLHLWRWRGGEFPMPPSILVGVKGLTNLTPEECRALRKSMFDA